MNGLSLINLQKTHGSFPSKSEAFHLSQTGDYLFTDIDRESMNSDEQKDSLHSSSTHSETNWDEDTYPQKHSPIPLQSSPILLTSQHTPQFIPNQKPNSMSTPSSLHVHSARLEPMTTSTSKISAVHLRAHLTHKWGERFLWLITGALAMWIVNWLDW